MSIYRNQAQRVYDHVKQQLGFTDQVLNDQFKISVDGMEKKIIEIIEKSPSLNGKKVADLMIKLFDEDQQRINNSPE
jgi:hypothetical protein